MSLAAIGKRQKPLAELGLELYRYQSALETGSVEQHHCNKNA